MYNTVCVCVCVCVRTLTFNVYLSFIMITDSSTVKSGITALTIWDYIIMTSSYEYRMQQNSPV